MLAAQPDELSSLLSAALHLLFVDQTAEVDRSRSIECECRGIKDTRKFLELLSNLYLYEIQSKKGDAFMRGGY